MGQQLLLQGFFFKAYAYGKAETELGWGEQASQHTSTAHEIKITQAAEVSSIFLK